jgi:PadR family transcriptional regulator PadR
MNQFDQLRKGSTNLLLLDILLDGTKYGYQIMRELDQRSEGYFKMTAALLYPALHQLEKEGLVESKWEEYPVKRRRKYYTITNKGRNALTKDQTAWQNFITNLLKTLKNPLPKIEG